MNESTVIALGFFDGVHIGHGELLKMAVRRAQEKNCRSAAFTFDRSPREFVTGQSVPLLTTSGQRAEIIRGQYGVQDVFVEPFDRNMMTMPWENFLSELLVGKYHAVHLVAGHDYRFGHKNEGDVEKLKAYCAAHGLGCDVIPRVELDGVTVSSSHIRALLEEGDAAPASAMHPYQLGLALRPKRGERVSGDSARQFELEDGTLCLLLSDGMGCGEAAQRESAMAVRLLERFLRAGIDAPPALKTLNSALSLRAESTDSFTTVDLLLLSLGTLEGELYKYGAAPSYLKRGGSVRRVTCSCLPAGVQEGAPPPEATHLRLSPGSFLVMVSDGVADREDDEWLQNLLAGWEGENPQLLVSAILAESIGRRGETDDALVLALYIPEDASPAEKV